MIILNDTKQKFHQKNNLINLKVNNENMFLFLEGLHVRQLE
jgi:hypothetical protein